MKRYYSEQLLNDINQRIDISDIVSETVKLTRKGNRYWGLCPFHQEKTPSFSVAPDKNLFYCFGCHAGGNIFTYIMKRDGLDFAEAVEVLAGRAGVALELNEGRSKREDEIKKRVLEVNQAAAQFFNQMLCQSTNPLEYIKGRGVNLDTIKQFQLGYALDSWNALEEYLLKKGFDQHYIKLSGLIKRGKTNRYYDPDSKKLLILPTDGLPLLQPENPNLIQAQFLDENKVLFQRYFDDYYGENTRYLYRVFCSYEKDRWKIYRLDWEQIQ
jgi:DNA primase